MPSKPTDYTKPYNGTVCDWGRTYVDVESILCARLTVVSFSDVDPTRKACVMG